MIHNSSLNMVYSITVNDLFFPNALDIVFINRHFVVAPDGDAKAKTRGPNESIRNEEEYRHGANNGLKNAIHLCEEVKAKNLRVTYADLYQIRNNPKSMVVPVWQVVPTLNK
nr:L-ascorbate peroxidase 3-like [Tanacetum cinerariifolium]